MVNATPRPLYPFPPAETRYPLYRRLGGPEGSSGHCGKSRLHRDSIRNVENNQIKLTSTQVFLGFPVSISKC